MRPRFAAAPAALAIVAAPLGVCAGETRNGGVSASTRRASWRYHRKKETNVASRLPATFVSWRGALPYHGRLAECMKPA
jgi:hypothetical protein